LEKKTPGLAASLVLAGSAAALVAVVALAPMSSWSFKNQLDALQGGWRYGALSYVTGDMNTPLEPVGIFNPENLDGPSQVAKLAAASSLFPPDDGVTRPDEMRPITEALAHYCKAYPRDVIGWAILARRAQAGYTLPKPEEQRFTPEVRARVYATRTSDRREVLLAIANGSRLEPGNAYFTTLEAVVFQAAGDMKKARTTWIEASRQRSYHGHFMDEHLVRMKAVELKKGYRGEFFRALSMGIILFPHLTYLRRAAGEICKKRPADAELRLSIMRCAYNMAANGESSFEQIMAASIAKSAALPIKQSIPLTSKPTWEAVIEAGEELDRHVPGDGDLLPSATAIGKYFQRMAPEKLDWGTDPPLDMDYGQGLFTATHMLTALMLGAAMFLLLLIRKRGREVMIRARWFVPAALAWAAVIAAFAWLWVAAQTAEAQRDQLWWVSLALIAAGCVLLLRLNRPARALVVSSSLLVLAVTYVGAVGIDIRDNERYRKINEQFAKEAQRLKDRARSSYRATPARGLVAFAPDEARVGKDLERFH
jgi:hypothetical protein